MTRQRQRGGIRLRASAVPLHRTSAGRLKPAPVVPMTRQPASAPLRASAGRLKPAQFGPIAPARFVLMTRLRDSSPLRACAGRLPLRACAPRWARRARAARATNLGLPQDPMGGGRAYHFNAARAGRQSTVRRRGSRTVGRGDRAARVEFPYLFGVVQFDCGSNGVVDEPVRGQRSSVVVDTGGLLLRERPWEPRRKDDDRAAIRATRSLNS